MNRNSNSRFSIAPQVDIQRSTFDRSSSVKTSFNVGQCVPFYLEEVLPGDTFKIKTSKVARMQTLKTPVMDDVFLDTYYFFVPNRLVWTHWREFMGENTVSDWIPENTYTIPQITAPSGGWSVGTIADYLGIPTGVSNLSVNALPIRAYSLIVNEWFRDENLSDPLAIEFGDSTVSGSNGSTYTSDVAKGGLPFVACKTHDYFTSALPAPQKGPAVSLSVTGQSSELPVYTVKQPNVNFWDGKNTTASYNAYKTVVNKSYPLMYETYNAPKVTSTPDAVNPKIMQTGSRSLDGSQYGLIGLNGDASSPYQTYIQAGTGINYHGWNDQNLSSNAFGSSNSGLTPVNLVAGVGDLFSVVTINDLRQAFQIQRFYEKCARGGTRYIEIIKSHFGVTSPDARMQRPEYLGGNRLALNVRQITQTSSTTESSPMGDVAGMSVTTDSHFDFDKSFTEHGYIIGICVARYHHTYQQGLERTWNRKTKFDYYWPVFAHLGEQAIFNKEIYAQGSSADAEVFGYQEAFADYRYKPNRVSGMMRTASASGLDTWHFADSYASLPYLSDSWIREDKTNVDRTLTVSSSVSDQIFADIYVTNKTTRPMPMYSIPGLIDHF